MENKNLLIGLSIMILFNAALDATAIFMAVKLQQEPIIDRCLAYFRDTFQGYDNSIEVCRHFIDGKPIAPYQFGQESFSPSSK